MFGLFKDDPDFAEIAAEIRAAWEFDDDSEVDPAVYELSSNPPFPSPKTLPD
jgi:hypothetical protein